MDILAARKKAAERTREQQSKNAEAAVPVQPAIEEQAPAAEPAESRAPASPPESAPSHEDAATARNDTATVSEKALPEQAPAAEETVQTEELEMLSFRLGEEEYAVQVASVREVLKNRDLTLVPNAPDYMLGVMALRGTVLPVIDLSRRLGLPSGERGEKSRIVIVTVDDEDGGFLVDRVTGVVRIDAHSIRPVPETIEGGGEFLRGIARKGERLYILLDIGKVLGA